jgi:hypothetical protein
MQTNTRDGKPLPGCNVSTTFNATVGVLAVAAAAGLIYMTCRYFGWI